MAAAAMESAEAAVDQLSQDVNAPASDGELHLPSFNDPQGLEGDAAQLAMLNDVNLHVKIELGRTRMFVEDVLRLTANSVVELDKAAGDPVDIYVNDRHIARGEVLVLDETFCVRISEILQPVTREDG
ncbi:MAG: flagellar motor switch protein FliN [Planctomycetota bacterium]|jgi:flagellar motor switch protein FliN/FliY